MDNKLDTLITYYEEEKNRLLGIIDGYIKEWEYEFAHFHSQALFQVNEILRTLHTFQDRGYDEKRRKQRSIRYWEERFQEESAGHMREVFSKMVEEKKQELDKLHNFVNPIKADSAAFDNVLKNLFERRIMGFTLFLSKENNFRLDFTYKANELKVILPLVKRHLKSEVISHKNIVALQDIGFAYKSSMNRAFLMLRGDINVITQELKCRLARIVFEIFYFSSFEGQSCIIVKEKTIHR